MARHKKHHDEPHHAGGHGWMTSFADLLTLLLCFFVLLLTMRAMDDRKFEQAFGTFSGAFGVLGKSLEIGGMLSSVSPMGPPVPQIITKDLETVLDNNVSGVGGAVKTAASDVPPEPEAYKAQFETEIVKDGIETRIVAQVLFDGDTARLTPKANEMLLDVGRDLALASTDVRVESWLPVDVETGDEDAAWQLSLDRAASVADVLSRAEGLTRAQLSVMGYARPAPRVLRIDPAAPTIVILARTERPRAEPPPPPAEKPTGDATTGQKPGDPQAPFDPERDLLPDAINPRN